MHADTGCTGTPRAIGGCAVLEVESPANRADTPAGACPGGDPPLYRGAGKIGEQRLVPPPWIRFVRVDLRAQAAALEELDDAPHNANRDSVGLRIVRREQSVKAYAPVCVLGVDAVEDEGVKVDTKVQGAAETLLFLFSTGVTWISMWLSSLS